MDSDPAQNQPSSHNSMKFALQGKGWEQGHLLHSVDFFLIFVTALIGTTANQNAYFEGLVLSSSSAASAIVPCYHFSAGLFNPPDSFTPITRFLLQANPLVG